MRRIEKGISRRHLICFSPNFSKMTHPFFFSSLPRPFLTFIPRPHGLYEMMMVGAALLLYDPFTLFSSSGQVF
jgi:hypothetical protein